MSKFKTFRRGVKRVARKVGKTIKGRYFKGKGYRKPRVGNIVRDVLLLKKMVNAEKKRLLGNWSGVVGQVAGATGSGHLLLDITPNPGQGVGYNQKSGSSIKWHSSHYDFQITAMANNLNGMRLKFQLIKIVGQAQGSVPTAILDKFVNSNRFITGGSVYDINCDRNPDYFKNFKVLKTMYCSLKNDDMSGELQVRRIKMGKMFGHHVRNDLNSATITEGQIILMITADKGNSDLTVASTLSGVPITGAQTGCFVACEYTHYYYDN